MMDSSSERTTAAEDMGAVCVSCPGRRFRRSRLQWKDGSTLLSLLYPVRCLSCSKRQTVPLSVARRAVPSSVKQVRAPQPEEVPLARTAAVDPSVGRLELPKREPITMPDLHGITLEHVAYVPPGDGENLVS